MQRSPRCRRVRRLFSSFLSAFRWVRTNGRTHVLVDEREDEARGKYPIRWGEEKGAKQARSRVRDVRIFTRDRHNTRGCMPRHGTEIVTGVELSNSVCVACARSPCNGCMPRGYFQVPVWNTADKIRVFRGRYREDDPIAALGVIISQVLIRARNENSVKIKWQSIRRWAISTFYVSKRSKSLF